MKHKKVTVTMLLVVFILAACGGSATEMMEKDTEEAMLPHDTPMPDAMGEPTETAMSESPAWFGVSLVNVHTGSSFTINDFKGDVILVETMAIWCSNCRRQQEQVKELHALLGERDDFVSLGLDIDPNESAGALKSYVDANGFDWYYAVPPVEVVREIASLHGDQFLNPPSTPMLIIDRHGVAHPLPFGIKSAEDLLRALQPFLGEVM